MSKKKFLSSVKKIPIVVVKKVRIIYFFSLFKISKDWVILNRISMKLRPLLWRQTGCRIGNNVKIGYDVYYDVHNASLITIEDNVWIASRSLLLCHKRNLSTYKMFDDYNGLPYIKRPVTLKKGCVVGMGSIVMPGVTVGEGAIIAAGSLVVHDVPAWTVVAGNPATVLRDIKKKRIANTPKVIKLNACKTKLGQLSETPKEVQTQ